MGELKHLLGKGASWDQSNGEFAHRVVISGNETLGTKGINNLFDKDTGTKLWFTKKKYTFTYHSKFVLVNLMNSEKKSILKSHAIRPNLRQRKGSELISVLERN